MRDFTIDTFSRLLTALKNQNYTFQSFAQFLKDPAPRSIILRHDVDARKLNSLKTAQLEKELGITGTYYFRIVPESFDEEVIKQIAALGHEIGYHYEDLSRAAERQKTKVKRQESGEQRTKSSGLRAQSTGQKVHDSKSPPDQSTSRPVDQWTSRPVDKVLPDEKLFEAAIISFRENLAKLRRVVPIETICMHGSPLSKYDNRMLWEKYDYRDFGIIGEPYFDIDFDIVLYLTDTGRRWDGEAVSVRDKAVGSWQLAKGRKGLRDEETKRRRDEKQPSTNNQQLSTLPKLRSTFDIINAAKEKKLPDKVMLTIHPQRWDNRPFPWIRELVWQNIKNIGKRMIRK